MNKDLMKYDEMYSRAAIYGENGYALQYRYFAPSLENGKRYPLVLFLHGMGERGHDNVSQIVNTDGAFMYADSDIQKDYPSFIIAPQCPDELSWSMNEIAELLYKLIAAFIKNNPVDKQRIYVTGLSMGGIGTWNIIAKYPDMFAAAMPICGATTVEIAQKVGQTPVWAFHAVDDPVVPAYGEMKSKTSSLFPTIYGSRLAVSAARLAGSMNIKYTEYPLGYIPNKYGHGHVSWIEAYHDMEAVKWLFNQTRDVRHEWRSVNPGVWEISDGKDDTFFIVEGKDKALVIDAGMGDCDVTKVIERITRLPYSLALTHGHGDHSMHAHRFDKVYIDKADVGMLYSDKFDGQTEPDKDKLVYIDENTEFDLGGGVVVKVVALPGHTKGSVLFVDEFHKCVFTGDAFGSGFWVWMQVPTGTKLADYKRSLMRAKEKLVGMGVNPAEWAFLAGHDSQIYQSNTCSYNPVSLQIMDDMAELCGKLISGEILGEPHDMDYFSKLGKVLYAKYGKAEMLYREDQLR